MLCHYTINIKTLFEFFYFFFYTAEDKIPEEDRRRILSTSLF